MITLTTLAVLYGSTLAFAQDACPLDPNKTSPGLCGCGVADSDWNNDLVPDSCIDPGASVDPAVTVGFRARVDAGATVGSGATLGAGSHVGAGSTIGSGTTLAKKASVGIGSTVGTGGTIGRRSSLGDNVHLGNNLAVARAVTVGSGTNGGDGITLGYGVTVGADVQFVTDGIRVANLASIGDRCTLSDGVRVGRGADIGADCTLGADVAIGPGVQAGNTLVAGQGTRIRRGATIGNGLTTGTFAIIGRDVTVGNGVGVGNGAVVRAAATLQDNADVSADTTVPRGATVEPSAFASCLEIRDSSANAGSGVYTINPTGVPGAEFDVFCDMDPTLDGGGWTLISNRRAATTESCAGPISTFFDTGCGTPTAIGANDSYALTRAQRTSLPRGEMLVVQYLSGVRDDDDAYIVDLTGVTADLFPHDTGMAEVETTVPGVCTLDGTCDTSGVFWVYTGNSWFHSGQCNGGAANNPAYGGNYGICHLGQGSTYPASSFAGNRSAYAETKLWGHSGGSAAAYQERIYYR